LPDQPDLDDDEDDPPSPAVDVDEPGLPDQPTFDDPPDGAQAWKFPDGSTEFEIQPPAPPPIGVFDTPNNYPPLPPQPMAVDEASTLAGINAPTTAKPDVPPSSAPSGGAEDGGGLATKINEIWEWMREVKHGLEQGDYFRLP
jgi:hypothetical protein